MRIHVINPNTTASMTAKIGDAAKAAASPGVEVRAVNPDFGPRSIEGYFDEAGYSEIEAAGYAAQLVAAVAHCHSKNVLLRNLKPENIGVVTEANGMETLKIANFTYALALASASSLSHEALPEDDFAPHERSPSAGTGFGLPVDIFALGCIIYSMLSGFPPFDISLGLLTLEFPSPYFDAVSSKAKSLITDMTNPNPHARPTALALQHHSWFHNGEADSGPTLHSAIQRSSLMKSARASRRSTLGDSIFNDDDRSTEADMVGELERNTDWSRRLSAVVSDDAYLAGLRESIGSLYSTFGSDTA